MPDIFLSYNREDQAVARTFADALEAEGFEVWWDADLKSGEAYDEVTEQALRDAKAVVVLWSPRSVMSRWVRAEATLADRNRTLVPAMIEACERPIMFELTQTAELSHWKGDRADRAWRGFLADVRPLVGDGHAAPPPAAARAPAPAAPANPRGGRPSLAILPFTNRSGERADDFFALGMVEDVIAALSLSKGVKVIAQSATAVYRKNVSDLRAIGRELGARYILEGNVRRVGTDLRVTTQLVEAESAAILWSQRFDRPLAELAMLQEDLVTELAAELGVQVQRIEMEKALRKPGDLTAWEAVMRAWGAYARHGMDSLPVAIAEARRAVALAPDYAVANATLAMALGLAFFYQGVADEAMKSEAWAIADRALALDAGNATVLFQVSTCLLTTGRPADALAYAQRAVDINPNLSLGRQALAQALICFGRTDEALAQLDIDAVLAPRGLFRYLAIGYRCVALAVKGDFEAALASSEQSLLLNPAWAIAWSQKSYVLAKLGRGGEALQAARRCLDLEPGVTREMLEVRGRHMPFPDAFTSDFMTTVVPLFQQIWDEAKPA